MHWSSCFASTHLNQYARRFCRTTTYRNSKFNLDYRRTRVLGPRRPTAEPYAGRPPIRWAAVHAAGVVVPPCACGNRGHIHALAELLERRTGRDAGPGAARKGIGVRSDGPAMSFPLIEVKVLDLADEPAALAARLLADLGADVVRVEHPGGDWLRERGPFVGDEPGPERGLAHFLYNAGKRSVALDLETVEGQARLGQLMANASVVIAPLEASHSLRDILARDTFHAAYPRVGLVQPVFRRDSNDRATDLTAVAAGGQLFLNGDP